MVEKRRHVPRCLRFEPEADDSIMEFAGPVRPFGEVLIEGHNRQPPPDGPAENLLILVPFETRFAGVNHLMSVPAQSVGNFDSDVLVEEETVHQSRKEVSSVDSTDSLANSIAARISSSVSPGKPFRIASTDSPAASWLKMEVT